MMDYKLFLSRIVGSYCTFPAHVTYGTVRIVLRNFVFHTQLLYCFELFSQHLTVPYFVQCLILVFFIVGLLDSAKEIIGLDQSSLYFASS